MGNTTRSARVAIGWTIAITIVILSGCLTGRQGALVEDVAGRYSYRITSELEEVTVETSFAHYVHAEPSIDAWIVAAEGSLEREALGNAFARAGIDYDALESDGISGFGLWRLERFTPENGEWYAVAHQYRGNTAYAFIVRGGSDADPDSLPNAVFGPLATFSFTEDAGEVFRPESLAELEEYIDRLVTQTGGSVSIAAIKDGEVVFAYASGAADPESRASSEHSYHWGSITKIATSTAIMQLVDRGAVDLDATVDTYLPEWPLGRTITVRDLLGHTSGLVEDRNINYLTTFGDQTMPSLEDVWTEYWPTVTTTAYEPRTASVYTNFNFLVLGVIVERLTGDSLVTYVQREIFDPIGMETTAHRSRDLPATVVEAAPVIPVHQLESLLHQLEHAGNGYAETVREENETLVYLKPFDIFPAWGGVKGTAADAARFGQLFIDNGETPNGTLLERKTVREMMVAQESVGGDPLTFGLGWRVGRVGRTRYVEHSGGGPGIDSLLRVYPRKGISIAVLGSVVGYGSGTILEHAYDLID